jgi:large subunit ribosomal protein L25
MKSSSLKAFPRTESGRLGVRKLRKTGRVPAVIYGRKTEPRNIEVDAKELKQLIHGAVSENVVVDLSIESDTAKSRLAVVQEVQHNPVSGIVLHVDFHEVDESEPVEIMVPLETTGEAIGVKQSGGMLEHVMFKVKVKALPRDLPEMIMIDVTELAAGHAIHLGEIKAPKGVEILGDSSLPVVSIAEPRSAEAADEAAAAPVAAPAEEKKADAKKPEAKKA